MRGMQMPSMPGFPAMPGGLSFEEMSSVPPSSAPTPTVLLKMKEGDEYKL